MARDIGEMMVDVENLLRNTGLIVTRMQRVGKQMTVRHRDIRKTERDEIGRWRMEKTVIEDHIRAEIL